MSTAETTPNAAREAAPETLAKALLALADRRLFCEILSQARSHGVRTAWEGSSHGHRPRGLIKGTIKMTNDWNTSDSCSIHITDGDRWSLDICRDSCAYGNPDPQPVNGKTIYAWDSGHWRSEELRQALEAPVLAILCDAIETIEWSKAEKKKAQEIEAEERTRQHREAMDKAIARATGGAQ